jgi:hypothetical protein
MSNTAPLFTDDLFTLAQASRALPRNTNGKSVDIRTLQRWAARGCRGVHLELTRVGGRVFVSREALLAFVRRRSETSAQISNPSPSVASARAAAQLKRRGA